MWWSDADKTVAANYDDNDGSFAPTVPQQARSGVENVDDDAIIIIGSTRTKPRPVM